MPDNDRKPSLRFKGFNDAWEQCEFGDILNTHPFKAFLANPSPDGEFEVIQQGALPVIGYANGEPFTNFDDIVLFGDHTVSIYKPRKPFFLATDGVKIVSSNGINGDFLYYMFEKYKPTQQGYTRHFLMLKEVPISFPKISNEMLMISSFLCKLDTLITLHQRKYDKLVNVKKALLDKMFPENGNDVPKVRFKGFTDAWEQRKVGELLMERNEQAPMSDEYPLMAFIANEGVAPKGERYDRSSLVSDTENKLYKRTDFGDFIYSSNNLETGSIGLNKYGKASISPVYSIFQPTELADSDFLGRRLVRKDFTNAMIKWRQGVIYGQWRIHESDFVKIEVPVPSVDEQQKIGLLLDNLDSLITLHQRKHEKLQNIKKALLSKMFA